MIEVATNLNGEKELPFVVLAGGKTSFTGTHTIAADGKSFTNTYKTNGKGEPSSAALVYEKQ